MSFIALDSELVVTLQATLEATRMELQKVQQMGRLDEPMTIKQATAYLGVSRKTLSTYFSRGVIKPCEYGSRIWVYRSELDNFLTAHKRR
jgi:excisionase family DNA binding protein